MPKDTYGSRRFKPYQSSKKGISKYKRGLKKFFRKGLATLGEKKIYEYLD